MASHYDGPEVQRADKLHDVAQRTDDIVNGRRRARTRHSTHSARTASRARRSRPPRTMCGTTRNSSSTLPSALKKKNIEILNYCVLFISTSITFPLEELLN